MQLHLDDDIFVRAPTSVAYRRVTNMRDWAQWWRGCTVTPLDDVRGAEQWQIEFRHGRFGGLRMAGAPHRYQHDRSFRIDLAGDVDGFAEFWLEAVPGGTVVHHVLVAETSRRPRRTLRVYRTAVRRGLWGLKDDLQTSVRSALGMAP